jgi:hypothetical protein
MDITISFTATFPKVDRAQRFIDAYAEVYGPLVRMGRTVEWAWVTDPEAKAAEFGTSPTQELAWTIDAFSENVGYYGSDSRHRATLAWSIEGTDQAGERRAPVSY